MLVAVLVAGGLNSSAIGSGQRPGWPGVIASVLFVVSWVGYLAAAGRPQRLATLRRLNACWAAIIAGSALTASLVGLPLTGQNAAEGAFAITSLLLAAPVYGLTGLVGGEHFPLGMSGLAVACYLGLLAFAIARLRAPRAKLAASRG
ncbi:hypothetical protein [Propionicimonas paludicola]|uniref:hypothetical protein n=1 Tax=Propionicimonas paludicola TaxID=185243 RepID=UPI000BF446B0|nr:hypothetical protein [Propionicimonas paludicola]